VHVALHSVGSPVFWVGFTALVVALLALDFGVFHRQHRALSVRRAGLELSFWVALALAFNIGVLLQFGVARAAEFFTGYLLEYTLSVDNLFVFLLIFSYFHVPDEVQHRALYWGVIGSILLRGILILVGSTVSQTFHWTLYIAGAFLVYTGAKLFFQRDAGLDPEHNPVIRFFRRFVPMVADFRGTRFTVVEEGKRHATPLLLVLSVLAVANVVFATDSIPAIFGVTLDPFIIITSNVFACLGLLSLYFVISRMMAKFHFLQSGLSLVLIFIGLKMLLADILEKRGFPIPVWASLAVVTLVLATSVVASLLRPHPPA
jgi:tellurite resistance protein TerC